MSNMLSSDLQQFTIILLTPNQQPRPGRGCWLGVSNIMVNCCRSDDSIFDIYDLDGKFVNYFAIGCYSDFNVCSFSGNVIVFTNLEGDIFIAEDVLGQEKIRKFSYFKEIHGGVGNLSLSADGSILAATVTLDHRSNLYFMETKTFNIIKIIEMKEGLVSFSFDQTYASNPSST